jgi:3-hydroxyacyl-CoA dehydrogenase
MVTASLRDGVAVLLVDNPPVNALAAGVPESLAAKVEAAAHNSDVFAIVIAGAGRTFIAGADIKQLELAAWGDASAAPDFRPLFRQIEDSVKPIVVAMHGTTLGGGLELAMAGHYRVAVADAQLGLPEVNLGIIPGAEGTQRLPRLVGVERAIGMCVSGKTIKAPEALAAGLIDRIIEGDLMAGAVTFAREVAASAERPPKTRERKDAIGDPAGAVDQLAAGRLLARQTRRHSMAALAAIDAIEAAVTMPFDAGSRRERELCAGCIASEQCKALIHVFFAERAVTKIPDLPSDLVAAPIDTVAIVGAGTMGGGIAMACANAGFKVLVQDTTAEAIERGIGTIRRNYERSMKRGRFTPQQVEERLGRIGARQDRQGFETADLIIEAVFEDLALKKEVLAALDPIAKPGAILATNTSTLSIDDIAAATTRPASVIGLHFFSPANVMRLLEIVRGSATNAAVLATSLAFAKRLAKVGVVVGNGPGFVGNRMMFPYMYETQFLIEDGATPEQVDRALTDWGMAMGMFAVDDMAGRDVGWRVREEMRHFADPELRKPLVAEKLNALRRFGQKTGSGWYVYGDDRKAAPDPEVLAIIEQTSHEAGIVRRSFADEEIIERTIYALINEGARVLEEGIAMRASDIDVVYVNGYGFPAWRGGPMFFADRTGLARIHNRVAAFHAEYGKRWQPAPLLERLATEGRTFREWDASRA